MGKTCGKIKTVTCNSTPTDRKQTPTTTVHEDKHGSVIRSAKVSEAITTLCGEECGFSIKTRLTNCPHTRSAIMYMKNVLKYIHYNISHVLNV